MELYLLQEDFSILDGPFAEFSSLVWSERYFETGTFTLHAPREIISRFRNAAYITDGEKCGRVEYCITDEDGGCEIGGHLLEILLADRRMLGEGSYTGMLTGAVLQAVKDNLRGLGITIGESVQVTDEAALSYDCGDNLSEWMYSVLKPHGMSYRITLDWQTLTPVFTLVQGADRCTDSGNSAAQPAIFSASFGNMVSISFEQDESDYRNVVYVEGSDGTVVEVDHSGGGHRREYYRKATDITPSKFADTAAYEAALQRRGEETLAKYPAGFYVQAETDTDALPQYGVDYALGDVCDVVDEELGLAYGMRLTAVDTVYENGLCLICPAFGEEISRFKRVLMG